MKELKALLTRRPALTLAVAESLTCGQIQARVGAIPGASEFFLGGITTYSLDQKVRHLGVDRAAARKVASVSAMVALEMARGAVELFGADLAVATTGYAEPSRTDKVTSPFAWWGLAHRQRRRFVALHTGRIECPGASRTEAQALVAEAALAELISYLSAWRNAARRR